MIKIKDLAHEFRSRHATNPRDKLYSLLGLMANAEDRGIVPDYSRPVREIYMDFVKSHINQYQSLAILSFAEYRGSQYLSLSTWCPNWTVQALNPAPFWKKAANDLDMWLHESQDYYFAAGSSKACFIPHPDPGILGVRGFVFDYILAIGSVATVPYKHRRRQAQESGWDTYRFSNRRRTRIVKPSRPKKLVQWDWRDLALGPRSDKISQHSPYGQEPERSATYYHTLTANILGDRVIGWSFMVDESFESDFLGKGEVCRIIDLACLGRRIFVSRRGFMGLAPATAQKGDLIVVLFGGNIPFILRALAKTIK